MSIHDNVFDLIDEMAEPTGPILSWKAQVHIKQYIKNPEMDASATGKAIAKKLRQCKLFMEDLAADQIVYEMENNMYTEDWLNEWLDVMYSVCNDRRIFVTK